MNNLMRAHHLPGKGIFFSNLTDFNSSSLNGENKIFNERSRNYLIENKDFQRIIFTLN